MQLEDPGTSGGGRDDDAAAAAAAKDDVHVLGQVRQVQAALKRNLSGDESESRVSGSRFAADQMSPVAFVLFFQSTRTD